MVPCVSAVEVNELVVRYGDLVAVDHLSFTAEAGTVTAILGPNGAGKTSTIEVLEGYRRATAGRARVIDLDPIVEHHELVRHIGVMLQQGGVYPTMRVHEAAQLFCAHYGNVRNVDELIELVGLSERATSAWKQLSGGEQQRLSLALALAGRPQVAFLDEPTASVDVAGRQVVRRIIRDLARLGCCVLLATHELEEAERVADRVLIIDHGRLVAAGSLEELRGANGTDEIRFGGPPEIDLSGLAARLGAAVEGVGPGEYLVRTPPTPTAIASLTAWLAEHDLPLADLRAGRKSLEDVFLALTAETSVAAEPPSSANERRQRGRVRAQDRS